MKLQIRNPKIEIRSNRGAFGIRVSELFRASGFEFRFFSAGNVLAALALSFLTSCATSEKNPAPPQPAINLVWPKPPDPPRIAYVQSIYSPADVGVKSSGFSRFANWLTGSPRSSGAFVKPFGIALDENDNLCVTDDGTKAVCFFDRAKTKWSRWEKIGKQRFSSPVAIARRNGIFYVADSDRAAVIAFNERGKLVFELTNHLARPCGLVVNGERLYVVDSKRHCVVAFDLRGQFV